MYVCIFVRLDHFEEDAQMTQALAKHCKASSASFLILIRSCVCVVYMN